MGKTQPLKLFLIKRNLDNDNKFIRLFFKTHLTYEAVNLTVKHVNLKKNMCRSKKFAQSGSYLGPTLFNVEKGTGN